MTKILGVTNSKVFANNKLYFARMMISLLDTVEKRWEKEKMLVTRVYSFSHSVFLGLLLRGHLKSGLCGKELSLL